MATKTNKMANVPNLRFPGFEGEWIPAKLENIAEKVNSGKTPLGGESTYLTDGVVFIRSQNVNNNRLELENPVFISDAVNNGMKNSIVKANDILLNITGASLGRSCVVPNDFKLGNVNQHVCIIRLKKESDPRFIQPILSSAKGQSIFESLQTGSGREGLNFESIKKIELDLPSVAEQVKIANFLSLIDRRIQTQNKIIKQLESLIKKLRQKIFNQELRFPQFTENWIKTTLSKQSSINPKTPPLAQKFVYIDLESVVKGEIIKDVYLERSEAPSRAERVLEDWDILFQCVRPYQLNNYLYRKIDDKQWVASTGYAQLRTNNNNPTFIYNLLYDTSFNLQVMMRCTGTSYPAISGNDLGKIPIAICSLNEQEKIANLLSRIDGKIKIEKKLFYHYLNQKNYLLKSLLI
jgi:type I restriction enzyme S subunit